jgi:hypothetical protein
MRKRCIELRVKDEKDKERELVDGMLTLEELGISWLPSRRPPDKSIDELIEERLAEIAEWSLEKSLYEAAKEYSTYADDMDVLKVGWQLGVKRYGKKRATSGIATYEEWPIYSGLTEEESKKINEWLWDMAFEQGTLDLEKLVDGLSREFGLDENKARLIIRTEMANIFNKAREWAYATETGALKFRWVTRLGACEKCKSVEDAARRGVSLAELKKIIKTIGGESAREWTVHPLCRCTFKAIRRRGEKWWE